MALDEGVEGGQPDRRRDGLGGVLLAEDVHEAVDLADRLTSNLLDRLERGAGALGIALAQEPRRAGLDEDDVERVPGRVVQVAGDSRALLGDGDPQLPLRLLLAAADALAPHPHAVADHPRAAPEQTAEQRRHDREVVVPDPGRREVEREEARDDGRRHAASCTRGMEAEREQGDRRPERRPRRVVEPVEQAAGCRGQREDGEGRAPPGEQRQGRERDEEDREQICVAVAVGRSAVVAGDCAERDEERHGGDGDVHGQPARERYLPFSHLFDPSVAPPSWVERRPAG